MKNGSCKGSVFSFPPAGRHLERVVWRDNETILNNFPKTGLVYKINRRLSRMACLQCASTAGIFVNYTNLLKFVKILFYAYLNFIRLSNISKIF